MFKSGTRRSQQDEQGSRKFKRIKTQNYIEPDQKIYLDEETRNLS